MSRWHNIVRVDVTRPGDVEAPLLAPVHTARVSHIQRHQVRRETQPVRPHQAVDDGSDRPAGGLESVDLAWQLGFRADALPVPVGWVGEPDGSVLWVDDHVVDAVEGPAVEGAD